MLKRASLIVLIAGLLAAPAFASSDAVSPLEWRDWSDDLFTTAKTEKKLVILDLEAVWCHWCHVMAETTYVEPKVVDLLSKHFLTVRVDQDAHPDLANRYQDYGWPATIVFDSDGNEIVKRRGHIPPDRMAALLDAIVKDPTPGPSVLAETEVKPENAFLTPEQVGKLKEARESAWDAEFAGWGEGHKLIDSDNLEYAMAQARAGDEGEKKKALATLDAALNLEDKVWGGFYQYSDERNWKSPHFEKIMGIQAQYLRLYSLAYGFFGKKEYLEAARHTADYLRGFWTSEEGAFYVSQDADLNADVHGKDYYSKDDAGRRALGMPRIDKNSYARENGWAISSLAELFQVDPDPRHLSDAIRAANWVRQNRSLEGGGFRHDEADRAGPYLGDTLAMGQAFLNLYVVTADRQWLESAENAAAFIEGRFRIGDAGYQTSVPVSTAGVFAKPVRLVDENIAIARWSNALFRYTGAEQYKKTAEHAIRYLASPAIVDNKPFLTGVLLADAQIASDPVHITVIGPKTDGSAAALFAEAIRYPSHYKRIEWWDPAEGPLPNPDVRYPEMERPAAFACANGSCSLPVFEPQSIAPTVDRSYKK